MYKRQKGLRPILTQFNAIIILLFGMAFSISVGFEIYNNEYSITEKILITLLPFAVFALPGFRLASKYTDIRVTSSGIQYRYLQFFRGEILWEEISAILKLDRSKSLINYYALVIDREGFKFPFVCKGLYFQYLHGIKLRTFAPVILLSPGTLTSDEIKQIKDAAIKRDF